MFGKQELVGGLEHFLFSPIVGMMIQSDFHIPGGVETTNQYESSKTRINKLFDPKWTVLDPKPAHNVGRLVEWARVAASPK